MNKIWISTLLLALTFASTANSQLFSRKNARVITNAWASPEFIERRMSDEGPLPMTYHFLQGKYHGGNIRDKSLATYSIQEIAETLSTDMEEQKFFPAASTDEGDLLIVVHWGITAIETDLSEMFEEELNTETTIDDDGFETETTTSAGFSDRQGFNENMSQRRRNEILTGIDKALNKKGLSPTEEYELRSLLEDERYFVVLIAFDWQKLRVDKEREVQWITRFSLPAIGTNFSNAIPALSRAAIPHIGTNLDEITKSKTQLGWGKGTVGELEVVKEINAAELEEITGSKKQ